MSTGHEEFLPAYLAEVAELLGFANRQLLHIEVALRTNEPSERESRELFRALHTIKGLSAMIDVEPIVAIAHRMENVLRASEKHGGVTEHAIDPLLRGLRAIEQRIGALADGKAIEPVPEALLVRFEALDATAFTPPTLSALPAMELAIDPVVLAKLADADTTHLIRGVLAGRRAVLARFVPSPAQTANNRTITTIRASIGEIAEIVKVVPIGIPIAETAPNGLMFVLVLLTAASDETIAALLGTPVSAIDTIAEPPPRNTDTTTFTAWAPPTDTEPIKPGLVRVAVTRLDETMDALSAVLIGRSRLALAVTELEASGVDVRLLREILAEGKRDLRDLRASVLRLRMAPICETLERLPLVVRSLRIATGKQVCLETDAGETEVDKAVAERLFPAIVHLVRNAVDHAIESPDERRALGKPVEGVLHVRCRSHASNLEVSVSDDGRGVDRAAIAFRFGSPVPSDVALLEALCRPGLSTRETITTTSGRGMGMDIVRRIVVHELGGHLMLSSTLGVGTTFSIRVPLSLSITDAFLFECASQRFAVPVRVVDEIVELDPKAIVRPPQRPTDGRVDALGLIERHGRVIPLLLLASRLRLKDPKVATKALIIQRHSTPIAFGVDRLVGHQEIVMRPLLDSLVTRPGIAGTTDLGDGRPTLVLDLPRLGAIDQEAAS